MTAAVTSPRPVRPAATLVLVRDCMGSAGVEVLLLERVESHDHTSRAWVFPGGVVDPEDHQAASLCDVPESQASMRLGLEEGALAFYAAAVRECYEEAGLLLVRGPLKPDRPLPNRRENLYRWCGGADVRLATSDLHYFAHWLTPKGRSKRFDTRFFVAAAPAEQAAECDGRETLRHVWIRPDRALAPEFAGRLMTPTRATLELLRDFACVPDVVSWAQGLSEIACCEPRLAIGEDGALCSIPPGHPAYAEVGKLDPACRGEVSCHLRAGEVVKLGEHVLRVTDSQGLNHYRVWNEGSGWEHASGQDLRFVERDRIVIARDLDAVPGEVRRQARWLAPQRGFLVDLG